MLVVVVLCVVLVIALTIVHFRLSARVDALHGVAAELTDERDAVTARADATAADLDAARLERDEALERVNRARRDAADVANRLRDETAAKDALSRELADAHDALEAAAAQSTGPAAVLWDLAVRESEHRWRVSVAVDPSTGSPLDGATDRFRAAVEVEVDAAREESGAALDLVWKGETPPGAERAVVALALVRDVIATHGTAAAATTITIDCRDDAVEVSVDAVGADGTPVDVSIPDAIAVEPGRARIS